MFAIRMLSRRRVMSVLTAALLAGSMVVLGAQPSFAVHDNGMFEMEGNIAHDSASTPPYDWASLFNASGNQIVIPDPNNGPVLASSFTSDAAVPDQSYFTSNKDIQPIASGQQHWGCDPIKNPLDKDDLLNAYAALVQVPANAPDNAGHTVLYLGSERGSNNGTSFAGFWLFKDKNVGCSGTAAFSGQHVDGDILVVSDYTNGGGTQDVSVYRWTGNDASGSLVLQNTGGVCGGAANDTVCAIANAATITSPWSPTSHLSNTFVEAGIDLTAVLGAGGGCFTSFMAETRSSAELTATLKDFSAGQFNTCPQPPIETTATPGGSAIAPGSAQHDVATVSAVGNRPTPTGGVAFFLCAPAQVTAGGCETGGTQIGLSVPLANGSATSATASGATTTAVGKYCWRAEYTPDAASVPYYLASSHTNATTECFTVAHASPTIATQIAVTGANSPGLGFTTLGDTATLSGFLGDVTGETVTFRLYGPYASGVTPTCTTPLAFTTTGTLSANGTATTSQTFDPTAAGTYVWVASYPGDSFNDPIAGTCTDANESATIVSPNVSLAKTADALTVNAGEPIGFTVTASNSGVAGTGTAFGVVIDDPLPSGPGVDWSIVSGAPNCTILGTAPTQTVHCTAVDLAIGESESVHVVSDTAFESCTDYPNLATLTSTNAGTLTASASTTVLCPALGLEKTADAATVPLGDAIGFTVHVTNAGPGTAVNATIDDPLPSGPGIEWSIDPAYAGPGTCVIEVADSVQVLHCELGDLAVDADVSVHISSATSSESCGTYDNTATLAADNQASLTDSASTHLDCAAAAPLEEVPPLAATGAPIGVELWLAAALIVLGAVLSVATRRRRPQR